MTDIEQKALELVNEVRARNGSRAVEVMEDANRFNLHAALIDSIAAHEADKARHAAEMREQAERFSEVAKVVHDAVPHYFIVGGDHGQRTIRDFLSPFILAKPDPLEDVLSEAGYAVFPDDIERVRAALEARGLAIVKKEAVNG